jgi:hypothetical protein
MPALSVPEGSMGRQSGDMMGGKVTDRRRVEDYDPNSKGIGLLAMFTGYTD